MFTQCDAGKSRRSSDLSHMRPSMLFTQEVRLEDVEVDFRMISKEVHLEGRSSCCCVLWTKNCEFKVIGVAEGVLEGIVLIWEFVDAYLDP